MIDNAYGAGPDSGLIVALTSVHSHVCCCVSTYSWNLRNVVPVPFALLLVGFLSEFPQSEVLIGISVSTVDELSRVQISNWATWGKTAQCRWEVASVRCSVLGFWANISLSHQILEPHRASFRDFVSFHTYVSAEFEFSVKLLSLE